jgi:hypothetical protein
MSTLPPLPETSDIARQRAALHRQFDPFLRRRGLTASEGDRFVDLLIHQALARQDLQASVEAKGLPGDTPGIETLRRKLYAPITQELQTMLGYEGYQAFGQYEHMAFYRDGVAGGLIRKFNAANSPLSPSQEEQFLRLVATNDHAERVRPTDIGTVARVDWLGVAEGARDILTPPQLAVLQDYANQQSRPK